jgi:glutamate dehydrogenase (NAD(P)+)
MQILEYTDPIKRCPGYLVYDRMDCRLAAGGCRMQPGLTAETVGALAARMTLKQRVLGLNVDGAKCGIAYDPRSADCEQVLLRFLTWLRAELLRRFSMGCDMGTRFEQLERLAARAGIDSVKHAVKTAQELSDEEFRRRLALLHARVGFHTVGQRRAGHALAAVTIAAAREVGHPPRGLHVGLQGFGNLGRAAAESLIGHGAQVIAIADEHGCVVDPRGLDIPRMLLADQSRPVPAIVGQSLKLPGSALFDLPVDVLVLAAGADAMTTQQAAVLPIPVVVVGANYGLSACAERILIDCGALVVPDLIGGLGGSASMEALFGPARMPSPEGVLDLVFSLMTELAEDILSGARSRGVPPSRVAADIAATAAVSPNRRPYGSSPYASARRQPRGHRVQATTAHQGGGSR